MARLINHLEEVLAMLLLSICYIGALVILSMLIRSWRDHKEYKFNLLSVPIVLFWSLTIPVLMTRLSSFDILEVGIKFLVPFMLSGLLLAFTLIGLKVGSKKRLMFIFLFIMLYSELQLVNHPIYIVTALLGRL